MWLMVECLNLRWNEGMNIYRVLSETSSFCMHNVNTRRIDSRRTLSSWHELPNKWIHSWLVARVLPTTTKQVGFRPVVFKVFVCDMWTKTLDNSNSLSRKLNDVQIEISEWSLHFVSISREYWFCLWMFAFFNERNYSFHFKCMGISNSDAMHVHVADKTPECWLFALDSAT